MTQPTTAQRELSMHCSGIGRDGHCNPKKVPESEPAGEHSSNKGLREGFWVLGRMAGHVPEKPPAGGLLCLAV